MSELLREALVEMAARLRLFEEQLKRYEHQIAQFARNDPRAERSMTVPGVGPVTATTHRFRWSKLRLWIPDAYCDRHPFVAADGKLTRGRPG